MSKLSDLLEYDPNTGVLTWKPRGVARWDTRWAGKVAGTPDGKGYLQVGIHGKVQRAHRVCYALAHDIELSDVPPEIDHEDGDGCNNRKKNMRASTRLTNAKNGRIRARNTSGYKGVSWDASSGSWRASIMSNRKQKDKRGFATAKLAHEWYIEQTKAQHGEFGCGNVNGTF